MNTKKIYMSLLVALSVYSNAQNVLNAKLQEINFGSSGTPTDFIKLNDLLIFPATRHSDEGRELWSYNSATQKSNLLKDIFPGYNSGVDVPPFFTKVNNKVYFLAKQNFSYKQIWVTDGTIAGTQKLKDLTSNYSVEDMIAVGNKIFFFVNKELWVYDTTLNDLILLKTFEYTSGTMKLYSFNNQLYLAANDGLSGKEIWKSDGTIAGTVLLKDIATGTGNSISNDFRILTLNNKFYFIANTSTGYQLWESDGTSAGTVSIKPMQWIGELKGASANNYFVFWGFDSASGFEPWISDGTAAGTTNLKDIMPGTTSSMNGNGKFISYNNKIYFDNNYNGVSPYSASYIWETDGTTAGTVLFSTPANAILYGKSSDNQHLIFTKQNEVKYWITNGNSSQTFEVDNSNMPNNNSFIDLNSKIYMTGYNAKNGTELFSVDPVSHDVALASDINKIESSSPHSFEVLNNDLIFIAADRQYNNQIYKRNKNTQQLERLSGFGGSSFVGMYTDINDTFFKVGNYLYTKNSTPNPMSGLYRTDGTTTNSEAISTSTGTVTYDTSFYANLNDNTLLFSGYNNVIGTELWKIDNTSNTAVLVKDISTDNMGSMYNTDSKTAVLNGSAYFVAKENGKLGIWKSDGTSANTLKAIQFTYQDGTDGDIKVLNSFNNKLFFTKRQENNLNLSQNELWMSDGDQASSILLKSHASGGISRETEVFNNKLFYTVTGWPSGLYSTDGTIAGTTEVATGNFSGEVKFKKCGNQLFFSSNNGTQLWRTDGTNNGTYNLSTGLSSIKDMVCVNNYLYFLNGDSQKVWRSNGVASNTMPLDIFITNDDYQLLANENIQKLAADSDKLYFSINTKEHGSEFYEVTDPLPVFLATNTINTSRVKEGNIQVYPNPVSNSFSIKAPEGYRVETIRIFDGSGRLVKSIANTTNSINIEELSSGVYFLKIKTGKDEFFVKIIKK